MDLTLLQGTISGLKAAADIAKSLKELKDVSDVQDRVIALQGAILDAQSSAISANAVHNELLAEIDSLREEISTIKAWEQTKQRYKLHKPFESGVVYALKESLSYGDVPHYVCTVCFENSKLSILDSKMIPGQKASLVCSVCNAEVQSLYNVLLDPEFPPE